MQGAPITIGLFSLLVVAAVVGMIARISRRARPAQRDLARVSNGQIYAAVLDADIESHEPCLE
jgi:hypothetical protein